MPTLGDMAKALNRSAVYLHGVQARFELPVFEPRAMRMPTSLFFAPSFSCGC